MPRPDLPPGTQRDLIDALHDLHHRAGWPSLRTLARDAGCSHTTVSTVFSSTKLPGWGVLEVLVEAMDGDTTAFHKLWLVASTPSDGPPDSASAQPQLAGRKAELAAVGRHLASGAGLLLVTGEAGMGKTKLVATAAARADDTFVATGSCLPLSSEVPWLPVADALRAVRETDTGQWLDNALSRCDPYVRTSLSLLLPELTEWEPNPRDTGDDLARQHLFVAVRRTLGHLNTERRLSLLIEDLHWADSATLDLLEYLTARGPGVPIVEHGASTTRPPNVRTSTGSIAYAGLRRSRLSNSHHSAMTRPPSSWSLLAGWSRPAALVDSIHARTQGQPLFTEQLAVHTDNDSSMPSLLVDLLDARLGDLSGSTWSVARAMGVADRPLGGPVLAEMTGLTDAEMQLGLHELESRMLLAPTVKDTASLRHPLLAAAIRRRLVAGEASATHARVADALASSANPEPAEIARHWQSAGVRERELDWRISAAGVAHDRFALPQEAEEWLRVLELWPDGATEAGRPPIRRYEALVSVMDVLGAIGGERAAAVAAECLALVPDLPPLEAAELLQRVGAYYADLGEFDRGLDLLDRAIAIYDDAPPSDGHVRTLLMLGLALLGVGRRQDAAAAISRGLEVAVRARQPPVVPTNAHPTGLA